MTRKTHDKRTVQPDDKRKKEAGLQAVLADVAAIALSLARTYEARTRPVRKGRLHLV